MHIWFNSISFLVASNFIYAITTLRDAQNYYYETSGDNFAWVCQDDTDNDRTELSADWTRAKEDVGSWWFSGAASQHDNGPEDRRWKFKYCRPNSDNTHYNYVGEVTKSLLLPQTTRMSVWDKPCEPSQYGIYSISTDDDGAEVDRTWSITCKRIPYQFVFTDCHTTDWLNEYDKDLNWLDTQCIITSIQSEFEGEWNDRRFKFRYCLNVLYYPMYPSTTVYTDDRFLIGLESTYDKTSTLRSITARYWSKPRWYDGNVIVGVYYLTPTRPGDYYWARICPMNGGLMQFEKTYDNSFSFQCGILYAEISITACDWSSTWVNEFQGILDFTCPGDGPIRGIKSYYSDTSKDYKFNIFCCTLTWETFVKSTAIGVGVKTYHESDSGCDNCMAEQTIDLCWDNDLYQGILSFSAANTWVSTDVHSNLVKYGECGNERSVTLETADSDKIVITAVKVLDTGVNYLINGFNIPTSNGNSTTNQTFAFSNSTAEVIIQFPDAYILECYDSNYLNASESDGCVGDLSGLYDYLQYTITITPCGSYVFDDAADPPLQIAIILRGLSGNLDRKILTGPTFHEVSVGHGNIGEVIHMSIEHEQGPADFCIQAITLYDPHNPTVTFASDYFGDGIVLSGDCDQKYFTPLVGEQHVPCYDSGFSVKPYQSSLYTSIQIHACSGTDSGILAENSGQLTLTVTGLSKHGKFVSSDDMSLKLMPSRDWNGSVSHDYTFVVSGEFDKVTFAAINNNNADDLCVDNVLINGVPAFLTSYWVGLGTDHASKPLIPAILEWPICDIEMTTTITASHDLPMDPDSVATATCVNRNRLLPVTCQISQTFETHEEVEWSQQLGEQTSAETTTQSGGESSVGVSASFSREVGAEAGLEGVAKVTNKVSMSLTVDGSRSWSSSHSTTKGTTTMDTTTDGKVNGKTISVTCSGSVEVPPSQQVQYSLLFERQSVKLSTLTNMKMTKCSAYLYGTAAEKDSNQSKSIHFNPDDYIFIDKIPGELNVTHASTCYVEFSQATRESPAAITCGEERALAARTWSTFVPQCSASDPTQYKACQCAFGDLRTQPTCGCVDTSTGNLNDIYGASVVPETDDYKWTDWCEEYCGSGSYVVLGSRTGNNVTVSSDTYTSTSSGHDTSNESNSESDTVQSGSEATVKESEYDYTIYYASLLATMSLIAVTYCVNSLIACWKKRDLDSNLAMHSVEDHIVNNTTENANERQLQDATHPL